MPVLLVVGGGLFGSLAAAWARARGIDAVVFDAALPGAASPAAAGLFAERWAGRKLAEHHARALPLLERLYGIRTVTFRHDDGRPEPLLFVPPALVLEPQPVRRRVEAVGDGWLESGGRRHEGWVYVAAGAWSDELAPGPGVYGKTGAALVFAGEGPPRIRPFGPARQAIAFSRDAGSTYFSDGTAEREHTAEHDGVTLGHAAEMGLTGPVRRLVGRRPYAPGGPVFFRAGRRTWVGTGGRKLGTVLGASFAWRLVEQELR
jgi:glycine/D-amino acid oxidase-like deaminating enzyme